MNPAVLVSTAVAFPGQPEMVLARFVASLLTAVAVGWFCLNRGDRMRLRRRPDPPHLHGPGRFTATVRHDFLHASGFLVLGAMIAAAVNTFVPRSVVDTVAGQAVVGVLTLAAARLRGRPVLGVRRVRGGQPDARSRAPHSSPSWSSAPRWT